MSNNLPPLPAPIPPPADGDEGNAVDLLIHERPRILRTKLAVLATQLEERLKLRAAHLTQIEESLQVTGERLFALEELRAHGYTPDNALVTYWLERQAKLEAETRTVTAETWRDVASVMQEFLTVWEALEQSRVRAEFLRGQLREDPQ